jgi:hypothetical protein
MYHAEQEAEHLRVIELTFGLPEVWGQGHAGGRRKPSLAFARLHWLL